MTEPPNRPLARAMSRGFCGKCPDCGQGAIFYRYLKVSDACPVCGEELHHHRAHDLDQYPSDDGPAYFTILLTGHLVVAPLLLFPFIWKSPVGIVIPAVLIPLTLFTLLFLPRVKGAVVGMLYALSVRRQDAALHTADRLE
jgi:uncharacterized protein (DUF983 family)